MNTQEVLAELERKIGFMDRASLELEAVKYGVDLAYAKVLSREELNRFVFEHKKDTAIQNRR